MEKTRRVEASYTNAVLIIFSSLAQRNSNFNFHFSSRARLLERSTHESLTLKSKKTLFTQKCTLERVTGGSKQCDRARSYAIFSSILIGLSKFSTNQNAKYLYRVGPRWPDYLFNLAVCKLLFAQLF